jgi:hypothetical protein
MGAAKKLALAATVVMMGLIQIEGAFAAVDKSTCKVSTNDIGTIIGRGSSSSDAFEDAATQCFERREKLYRMKKGSSMDEDTGLAMIDNCANIRCGS